MDPREKKETVWVTFAANALPIAFTSTGGVDVKETSQIASEIADRMLDQWSARFGDAAFLLEGQNECATCQKKLPPGAVFMPSVDGVKFCSAKCLKESGREE